MNKIIVTTPEELRQIIKEVMPDGNKLSPEERYVTTEKLAEIFKVSVSQIHTYKTMEMYGYCGENLWEWQEAVRWRRDVYSKITRANRKRP